jgi:plastocyanin
MLRAAARTILAILVVSAIAVPATAGARTTRPETGPTARRATERVRIVDFSFRPRRIEVDRGTRVRWVNRGGAQHTTTSTSGLWDSGSMSTGDTFSRVFRKAGTFRFRCTIHPGMTGRVVVT